jgi:hypothetical protein
MVLMMMLLKPNIDLLIILIKEIYKIPKKNKKKIVQASFEEIIFSRANCAKSFTVNNMKYNKSTRSQMVSKIKSINNLLNHLESDEIASHFDQIIRKLLIVHPESSLFPLSV